MGTKPPSSLKEIFEHTVRKQGAKIATDPTHVLNMEYELLPLGKRYRLSFCRLNRLKFSLVPLSIKLLNGGSFP